MLKPEYGGPGLSRPPAFSRRAVLRGIFASAGLAAGFALYRHRPGGKPPLKSTPIAAPVTSAPSIPIEPDSVKVAQVYQESVLPLLNAFDHRNSQAVDRAMGMLHERVEMHRRRVGPFTRDVASWHTRFGILKRYPADLWHRLRGRGDARTVNEYVNGKFRQYILSEKGLERDVAAVLGQFNNDMAASRNQLYSQLLLPLQRIKTIRPAADLSLDRIRAEVRDRAQIVNQSMAPDTIATGLVGIAGGWIAADAAQAMTSRVVAQVLARVATAMAAEGIVAGGATVEGAAAGGGAGSLAGPVGTIIGIGVGLIIGAVVDWRLSKRFEAKVAEQCNRFLDNVETRLRDGNGQAPGLRQALRQTAELTGRAQKAAIQVALEENLQ